MDGNRDVILADFQACTDIDDVGEAIFHLEGTNWDLLAAINNVMPQNSQQLPSEINRDVEMIDEIPRAPSSSSITEIASIPRRANPYPDVQEVSAGTSSRYGGFNARSNFTSVIKKNPRNLTFLVSYADQIYEIKMLDTNSIADLKMEIFKNTKITPCQQQLHGWKKEPRSDSVSLRTLDLPTHNDLYMSPLIDLGDNASDVISISEKLQKDFKLNIKDESKNTTYNLKFPGSHTVLQVKTNVYTLIDVPVRNQLWKGWPATAKDESTLAQSGISFPEHNLSVGRIPTKEKKEVVLVDSDSSGDDDNEDYEDAPESFQVDDDIFIDNVQPRKPQYLISNNIEDEIIGTLEFSQEYEKRYGPCHPNFFAGTFEEALTESCSKPPSERKLLAVYLHHDNSILSNVFCTQLLGFETVLQLLSANFIVWGWDCTHKSNEQKFLISIQQSLGSTAAMTIRNIDVDTMPVLVIIMRMRSNTEIFTIVHGNVGVNDLLSNLIEAVDVFQEQRAIDVEVDKERQARERVKEEQDRAYQESLAVDRAKEEAKQLQEKMEKQRKEQAENEKAAEEAKKHAHRLAAESRLPPEPPENAKNIKRIRARVSEVQTFERRFLSDATVQTLLDFFVANGFPTEEYKVLTSWPKRDLTSLDTTLTLDQLNFNAQEMLFLQKR